MHVWDSFYYPCKLACDWYITTSTGANDTTKTLGGLINLTTDELCHVYVQ